MALATSIAACALFMLVLSGCGGDAQSTNAEVDAAYLRVAGGIRKLTVLVESAVEHPPRGSRQIARKFRSLASSVDYRATYLQTVRDLGPVGAKAFVLQNSLLIYEATLRDVAKHADGRERPPTGLFGGIREAGSEVRANLAAWEYALRASATGS